MSVVSSNGKVSVKDLIQQEAMDTAFELGYTNVGGVFCKPVAVIPKKNKWLRKPKRPKRSTSIKSKDKIKKPKRRRVV